MPLPLADLRSVRPGRVCLIKPSALGDVVNALPVLSALRAFWPQARFSWVVNRPLRRLLDGHPELDEVITYDRARSGFGPRGVATVSGLMATLRRGRFDLAIDLQGLLRSGVMALATGARVRVGLADAREGAAWAYTHRVVTPPHRVHAVDRLLTIVEAFGADIATPRFVLPIAAEDRAWARRALAEVAAPRVVLNPGASWPTKRWPPEHFAEVARRAVAARGAGLVTVGAPDDRPLIEALRARLGGLPVADLCGRTTLPQLAAVAAESGLFLSNDTGPLHLAAAAGARVVGLYTCTNPSLHGPYGPRAVAVATRVACAASHLKRCGHLSCFTELTPDRVWPVVLAQLDAIGVAAR